MKKAALDDYWKRHPQHTLMPGDRVRVVFDGYVKYGTVHSIGPKDNRLCLFVDGDEPENDRYFVFQLNSDRVAPTTIIDQIAELDDGSA